MVGWYYDTVSTKVTEECPEQRRQRFSFTPGADPVSTTLRFECPSLHGAACEEQP